MTIKAEVSKEAFDKLDEAIQKLYKRDGDGYKIQVEGMVSKSKLDEFRDNNIEANKQLEKFKDVDLDKYSQYEKTQQALDDKKLIDAGDVEGLISKRIEAMTVDFNGKLQVMSDENKKLKDSAASTMNKSVIQDAAHKAFDESRIKSDARGNILASINQLFEVDNGVAVARKEGAVISGSNGNLTINEFVSTQPDYMKEASTGGAGNGSEGGASGTGNKSSVQKIASGLASLSK